ncbi:MAG: hypothetical protein ACYSWQ_09385 [Planctomycetota bacterium]|jgi:hypothetical protein
MMNFSHGIKSGLSIASLVVFALIAGAFPNAVVATSVDEAYAEVADLLVLRQYLTGEWVGQENFTGSIVAGLTRAYEVTGKADYLSAAEMGVGYILDVAGGNFFGDEAYAMARLTEVTAEQAYADIVRGFYNGLDTAVYISGFEETDRSNAVFYVAHHTIAAHMVGAADAEMWRNALMYYLCLINDDLADYPVMSLGVATWALAQTGPMEDTQLDPNGSGEDYWAGVQLSDLPDILVAHLEISGDYNNSFGHRFDRTPAGPGFELGGYTEDTVFGLLGLIAADAAGWDFDQEIKNATETLATAVSGGGFVWEHIVLQYGRTSTHWVYGGELLETMPAEPALE